MKEKGNDNNNQIQSKIDFNTKELAGTCSNGVNTKAFDDQPLIQSRGML